VFVTPCAAFVGRGVAPTQKKIKPGKISGGGGGGLK